MTISGILGMSVILFAFRKGEKWSIPALALAGGIGLIGEIILEIMIFLSRGNIRRNRDTVAPTLYHSDDKSSLW